MKNVLILFNFMKPTTTTNNNTNANNKLKEIPEFWKFLIEIS